MVTFQARRRRTIRAHPVRGIEALELVKGKRGVSAETAWLPAQTLGTTPQF
jgi:plasmid maintenance system antidote protein VapI